MVKKITQIIIVLVLLFAIPLAASAQMALAWDEYTDPTATYLRIESSTDNSSFSTLVNDISTEALGSLVPNHTTDNQRVYYRLIAYNTSDQSTPSNTVSYFWTTNGGGQQGLLKPGDIHFVDCSNPQGGEVQFCLDIGASTP